MRFGAAVAIVLAAAGSAAADDAPAVDVEDLPPLPPPDESGEAGRASEVAAAAAEEDVVVGAAKREQSLGNVASAVTVISGDRLRRFGYRTVSEAIRGVAGVFVADDHMSERVGIRGLQPLGDFNTRILVLVDGATVTEPWGQFAGVGWDAPVAIDDVARIEVIRGPVSSLYGTNAFFGIINIVTRGADQSPRAWARAGGTGFLGGTLAGGFATGGVHRQLRGSVAATYRGGEAAFDHDALDGFNASIVGSWGGAFAQVRAYRRRRDLTFYPYLTTDGAEPNNNTDEQVMIEGGYTRAVSTAVSLTGRVYASRYRFSDYLNYEPDVFRDFGDASWIGAELRGRWDVLDRNRLGVTAGGETTFIDARSHSFLVGEDTAVIDTPLNVQGLYTEVDGQPLSWLAFTAGIRRDLSSKFENRWSPRIALFVNREDRFGLKLLYADGFRNPSPFEAFFEDGISYVPNPDLRAESIHSYEAVLWGRPRAGLSTRLSVFQWDATDIVEQDVEMTSGLLQFQNLGERHSKGVEAEATYRDARGWLGFGGLTIEKVRDERQKRVPGAPAVTASLGVSTPLLLERAHVSTEVAIIGPRPTRDEAVTAGSFVGWNAVVYLPDVRGFDVTVGVRNIIGRHERLPAQEDYDTEDELVSILPGEGREVHARVGYRF